MSVVAFERDKVKIVLTGPESTGKSTLCLLLAGHFNCPQVSEYARDYIQKLNRPYDYDDLLLIAQRQHELEQKARADASKLFICDTSLLTIKTWADDKYGKCHPWIEDTLKKEDTTLYLLCDIDIPWVSDPQREDPGRRDYLKGVYLQYLQSSGVRYQLISGNSKERLALAIQAIEHIAG